MLKTLKGKLVAAAAVFFLALTPLAVPAMVSAADDIGEGLKCGSTLSFEDASNCDVTGGTSRVSSLIEDAINIFSIIVGIVAVIMIIVGGFKYITSGGDSGNIQSAKNTIIYAVIGLVIVALAQFLVQFVLDKAIS